MTCSMLVTVAPGLDFVEVQALGFVLALKPVQLCDPFQKVGGAVVLTLLLGVFELGSGMCRQHMYSIFTSWPSM